MKFKAFTLAEILIALIIVAIVSAAVMSGFKGLTSNVNKPAFQKCYNHMVTTVNDMLNDKMAYPDIPISASDLTLMGLLNNYNEDGTTNNYKFFNQFKSRTLGAIETNTTKSNSMSFIAQDKSYWQITNASNSSTSYKVITFDVNGTDKLPNCPIDIDSANAAASKDCQDPDRFQFRVDRDGSIHIADLSGYNSKKQYNFLLDNNYLGNTK